MSMSSAETCRVARLARWGKPRTIHGYGTLNNRRIHVLRAEKALGKPLPRGAVVHHADGSKANDAPLVICQDSAYHNFLHKLLRVKRAGGDPHRDRICTSCRRVLPFEQFPGNALTTVYRCHECNRAHVKRMREKRTA